MVENEHYFEVEAKLTRAGSIAQGLYVTLDDLGESMSTDPRYYMVLACVQKIRELLDDAGDALDEYSMSLDSVE